jgi:hypothetical protein
MSGEDEVLVDANQFSCAGAPLRLRIAAIQFHKHSVVHAIGAEFLANGMEVSPVASVVSWTRSQATICHIHLGTLFDLRHDPGLTRRAKHWQDGRVEIDSCGLY